MFKKDEFYDWVIPKRTGREKLYHDLKVIINTNTIRLNVDFAKPYLKNGVPRVAFLLQADERPLMVPDPKEGVPFFTFKPLSGKSSGSFYFQNADLIKLILDRFGFTAQVEILEFDLKFFEKMSGMNFYELVLVQPIKREN